MRVILSKGAELRQSLGTSMGDAVRLSVLVCANGSVQDSTEK